jgi:outer membrane lipoprotein SlyB
MNAAPRFNRFAAGSLIAVTLVLTGCAGTSNSGAVYRPGQSQAEQTVRMGVVESVRTVSIEPERTGAGAIAGGIIGGIVGGSMGRGAGGVIASVLGGVGGGLAGDAIERNGNRREGLEITVKLDNGELRAITQEADEPFKPGERVRLLSGTGATRVTH